MISGPIAWVRRPKFSDGWRGNRRNRRVPVPYDKEIRQAVQVRALVDNFAAQHRVNDALAGIKIDKSEHRLGGAVNESDRNRTGCNERLRSQWIAHLAV
jgi:hypothetical protein